jgi:hypothetical protein
MLGEIASVSSKFKVQVEWVEVGLNFCCVMRDVG